jgi:hypothetical protein
MSFDAYTAYPTPPNNPASFAANYSGQGAPGAAHPGLLQALAQANDFTLEELQLNRQGLLSQRQQDRFNMGLPMGKIGCVSISLTVLSIPIVGGGIVAILGIFGPDALNLFSVLALVCAWLALSGLLAFISISGSSKQARKGRVAFVDGIVERERHEYQYSEGTSTNYHYVVYQPQPAVVNQQRFFVKGAAYDALVPGLRYRLYYLPESGKLVRVGPSLVSIEPLL